MSVRLFVFICLLLSQFACSSHPHVSENESALAGRAVAQQTEATNDKAATSAQAKTPAPATPPPVPVHNPFASSKSSADASVSGSDETVRQVEEKDIQCIKGSEIRWLQIEMTGDSGCKLWYTKDTGKKAIAWSDHTRAHCGKTRAKIIERLKTEGFTCQEE